MSKKSQKQINKSLLSESGKNVLKNRKTSIKPRIEAIIGSANVKRWTILRTSLSFDKNETFVGFLLDLAEEHLNRQPSKTASPPLQENNCEIPKRKINEIKDEKNDDTNGNKALDTSKEEKSKKKKSANKKEKNFDCKKKNEHDIRRAPELTLQESKTDTAKSEEESSEVKSRVAIKITLCQNCSTRHIQDHCPLSYPNFVIFDSLSIDEWREKYQKEYFCQKSQETADNELNQDDSDHLSFAKMSLPNFLLLRDTTTDHGLGVFTKIELREFTKFGPLIGKIVKEVDISEDSSMRDIWEIRTDNGNVYLNTEDLEEANWIKYVRPAPTKDDKNLSIVVKDNLLFFISTKVIKEEEELFYWQDSTLATNKKKLEKTSCGGCNMNFTHPLYYRIHCSIFHDIRYSLTIRKYHCKICGAAVLGKDNIMKHAAELHNGQGAYQCQFCKKFFLRLNYLEMHRTYGCSANPHRSRPLCDFCGRKFCQPQKLKVHIKRMHSDLAEVLKEFQCKICLKILGSRAALQRHLKEVHQKILDGACSCIRCGKHFQNKSNLKIHMLTHSGIKPFRCVVKSCNAAFTTKQCLQFHYKKVHSFTEEVMPKIERSIDYTFEAYSGQEEQEEKRRCEEEMQQQIDDESDGEESIGSSKTLEDDAALQTAPESPIIEDRSSPRAESPIMESYNFSTIKILSKGSKKWIGDPPLPPLKQEIYLSKDEGYERTKLATNLNEFTRHEASNASLLVEAALDSVCSEPNIDIDVSTTSNCTDALVNNLYTLAPSDALADVNYNESVCINESRDINLISPSVNDHISVTGDLNDELRHNQNMGIDYSGFHQEDFSPSNSPDMHHRTNFVRNYINTLSPQAQNYPAKNISPGAVPSPPRYDFGHTVPTDHLSSDDSNGMSAQNLSLHAKQDIQLDLSIYKSSYKLDSNSFQNRHTSKHYIDEEPSIDAEQVEQINQNISDNLQVVDIKVKETEESDRAVKYPDDLSTDIRGKFDLDLDLRSRSLYEATSDLDFRTKPYDIVDKPYDNSVESEFRSDRGFEPLVLNSSELQGLDMSARSFHSYSNINRYHHLYPDDLRLNYSPPAPSYTHADILRVVSLDLTPPGRHSVDLSLRTHPFANSRLLSEHAMQATPHRLLDQSRLLTSDLSTRILSDHTTNRILSNSDQLTANHLLTDDSRIIGEGRVSPIPAFGGYSVSQSPYHPTPLAPRPHVTSPTPTPYHHYSTYY